MASLLPDGILTTWKVSKKALTNPLLVLKSTDNGVTWSALSLTTHYTFNTTTNSVTFVTAPLATDLIRFEFETHTNMTENAVNSEVLALGEVWATDTNESARGGYLLSHLLNKVGTAWQFKTKQVNATIDVALGNKLATSAANEDVNHETYSLNETASPTVKTLQYITKENDKAYLNLVFKEMKFDVDWGDDSKFNIVDNVSTTTDDNGNTVLIGQKRIELPYFIEDKE